MLKSIDRDVSCVNTFAESTGIHHLDRVAYTEAAIKKSPSDLEMRAAHCEALRAMGRLPEAIAGYTDAIKSTKTPEELSVLYLGRAKTHQLLDSSAGAIDAINDYERCLHINPNSYEAHIGRAQMCEIINDMKPARESADAAIKLRPELSYGYIVRARINIDHRNFEPSKYDRTVADLEKAVSIGDCGRPDIMAVNWGRLESALADLKSIKSALEPNSPR